MFEDEAVPGATVVLGTDRRAAQQVAERWQELARGPDSPALPPERPDLTLTLKVSGSEVLFRATYEEAFGLIRGVFLRGGAAGLRSFFVDNGMVPRRGRDREGVGFQNPEDFLPADSAVAYRLLRAARTRVEATARERVRTLEPLLAAEATAKLRAAHAQIQAGGRYLSGPGVEQGTPFDDRVSVSVFGLRSNDAGDALVTELRRLRVFLAASEAATGRLRQARGQAASAAIRKLGPFAFVPPPVMAAGAPSTNTLADQAVARAVAADPQVIARTAEDAEARNDLIEQLAMAGLEHPVLFRIYRDANPDDRNGVARHVVESLRRADGANHRLTADLADDAGTVWEFPPAVRDGMAALGVPETSIAWVAAEERITEAQGPRLAAQLGMVSGVAAGGVALLGAAVAPPLAVAIALADAVINIVDAVQEYLNYRQLRAGFDAVFDPSLALGAEPGLFGTVLSIVLDLASVLPVPSGRAASAVP